MAATAATIIPAATAIAQEVGGERNIAIRALVQFVGTFGEAVAFDGDKLTERAADFVREYPGLRPQPHCTACA